MDPEPSTVSPQSQPLSTPGGRDGNKALGQVYAQIGRSALERALVLFGSGSEEGKHLLRSITAVNQITAPGKSSDLMPAEVANLFMQNSGPSGGGTPPSPQPGAPPGAGAMGPMPG